MLFWTLGILLVTVVYYLRFSFNHVHVVTEVRDTTKKNSFFDFSVLGMEAQVSCMLGKGSTTDLYLNPTPFTLMPGGLKRQPLKNHK